MTKTFLLTLVFTQFFICGLVAQTIPHLDRFENEIVNIESLQRKLDFNQDVILFVGSSSIRMWSDLESDMEPFQVLNAGFGGSTMLEVNHYFDRLVKNSRPQIIFYYCGENDIADFDASEKDVLKRFKKFMDMVDENIPVFFLSIKPSPSRWNKWDEMENANKLILDYAADKKQITYVDVSTPMLNGDKVRTDIFIEDDLHMNRAGYDIWKEIILEILDD